MSDETNNEFALPDPVRDHLGQQLRATYQIDATAPPQFLGDEPAVQIPDEFAPQIARLETRLKAHDEGKEAVEQALDKILDAFGVGPSEPVASRDGV